MLQYIHLHRNLVLSFSGRMVLSALLPIVLWGANPAFGYDSKDGSLNISGFIENATYERFHGVGLSKIRNTAQVEFIKDFGHVGIFSNLSFNSTLRATYDAVYDANDSEFGGKAGGAISFTSNGVPAGVLGPSAVPGGITTPWGASIVTAGNPGLPGGGGFGFDVTKNPNEGLVLLGSALHGDDGGVLLGVPVRPCNVDPRGCIDGYLDFDKDKLASPEFNNRADVIREAYFTGDINLKNGDVLSISLGRQQVVWGRTDLFRVLDVINPVDFSRNNIYDELEDIRIPMGILTTEYRFGAVGAFDDLNFQFLWKWEQFRPNNLGQGGSPNAIIDAGSFFRAMNNCWENGCTVSNFAGGGAQTDFPVHSIGIRQANLPGWKIDETDVGFRLEGVYNSVGFSLNTLYFRSQFPVLRGGVPAVNPFIVSGLTIPGLGAGGVEAPRDYLIAFDIDFPRIFLLGGSLDLYVDKILSAFRIEFAWTTGEEFANTLSPRLFSESNVARYVIGWDRPTFIPFLNKHRAFLLSAQLFGQHILDHQLESAPFGKIGMPDWKDNWIGTFLIKGWWKNDRLSPQILAAYDFRAQAAAIAPSVDWLINDNWRLVVGANFKVGTGARPFDDNRSANVFPPFTGGGPIGPSAGLNGFEPLGRFRSGPIGMAQQEDEIQISLRYRF